jgi:hypothetical protein
MKPKGTGVKFQKAQKPNTASLLSLPNKKLHKGNSPSYKALVHHKTATNNKFDPEMFINIKNAKLGNHRSKSL